MNAEDCRTGEQAVSSMAFVSSARYIDETGCGHFLLAASRGPGLTMTVPFMPAVS